MEAGEEVNISQMMRGLLGDAAASDTRAMELKVGQVVRGVIMQMLDNNEAVVNINGVPIRAALEVPMQQGQSAMLQVQAQSNAGLVVLKQIDLAASGHLPEETFKEWAKALSLPEQKWSAELVKDLRREGLALTRELSQAFQSAAAAKPANISTEQWMQASAAAAKRGLPLTAATVASMQQVMFGRSAHELLQTLQQQLSAAAGGGAASSAAAGEAQPLPPAAARVMTLLAEGAPLLRAAAGAAGGDAAQTAPQAAQSGSARGDLAAPAASQAAGAASGAETGAAAQQGSRAAASQAPANWLGQMMKWLGVDYELQLNKSLMTDAHNARAAAAPQQGAAAGADGNASAAASAARGGTAAGSAGEGVPVQSQAPQGEQLRAGTAQQARPAAETDMAAALRGLDSRGLADRGGVQIGSHIAAPPAGGGIDGGGSPLQHESLKSALLLLANADDVPPAMRETAHQLVQHITGQQLLLSPERNSSVFTHVTMFVPINGEDGAQTASIHIQTRRGRKGELDANNCRLLFNLSMSALGDTLVDVNVTDKIVSLNIWNDHPAAASLIDGSRQDVVESLGRAGYQLLSLRTTPLPKESGEQQPEAEKPAKAPQPPDLSQFSSSRYKGVDMRV